MSGFPGARAAGILAAVAVFLAHGGAEGGVVPAPASARLGAGSLDLARGTRIVVPPNDEAVREIADELARWLKEATGLTFKVRERSARAGVPSVRLSVDREAAELGAEGYRLVVTPRGAVIGAARPAGLFYGAQTLRQLPVRDATGGWRLPRVEIEDRPRFAWRGMHLDSGRHFMSVKFVKRYLDEIAALKFNRFHWHLTEDQGWRLRIRGYPRLARVGAWREGPDGRHGGSYSARDVREILAHAARRHVTVVPEIEMPGHCRAALAAYPELSCTGGPFEVPSRWGVYRDVYCAGNERTFAFLEDVLEEVLAMFPGPYVHIGADEVPKDRWRDCAKCQRRIEEEGLNGEEELQAYFVGRIVRFLEGRGRRVIGWDEVLEGGPPRGVVVQAWRGMRHGARALERGHEVIFSPTSHCYFDYKIGATSLERVYGFDPLAGTSEAGAAARVLGGEGCAWTERMPEPRVFPMVLPRMAALAEALWSPGGARDFGRFAERMEGYLAALRRRGVAYGPGFPGIPDEPVRTARPARVEATLEAYRDYAPERAHDGSIDSYFWGARPVERGDTVTLTLERAARFRTVEAMTGFGLGDQLDDGVLEVSEDGRSFRRVATFRRGRARGRTGRRPVKAVRLRATAAQEGWLIVREIALE